MIVKFWGEFKIKKKKHLIWTAISAIIWVVYVYKAGEIFSTIDEFVTPDASYVVKLLEFITYRGNQVFYLLTFYLVLFSLSIAIFVTLNKKYSQEKGMVAKIYYFVFLPILILVLFYLSNIFSLIYLIITLICLLVTYTSLQMSEVLWGKTINYNEGELIYKSDSFTTEEAAYSAMQEQANRIERQIYYKIGNEKLESNVVEEEEEEKLFFFEIYAQNALTLNILTKGEDIE